MIRPGLTLRAEAEPRHVWIVLSDPTETPDGAILMVNLTSLTEKCVDDCCILSPADYSPVLKHKTVVVEISLAGAENIARRGTVVHDWSG